MKGADKQTLRRGSIESDDPFRAAPPPNKKKEVTNGHSPLLW